MRRRSFLMTHRSLLFGGQPNRVFLYVPEEAREDALQRMPPDASYLLAESGGKYIFVNQPVRAGMQTLADFLAARKAPK